MTQGTRTSPFRVLRYDIEKYKKEERKEGKYNNKRTVLQISTRLLKSDYTE